MNKLTYFTIAFMLMLIVHLPQCKKNPEEADTLRISGSVGISGVTIRGVGHVLMEGLPGRVLTDENGRYSAVVEYGWSGTVTPIKEACTFDPPSRTYNKVACNLANENYAAAQITFTISGKAEEAGVLLKGLPGNPVTDAKGSYTTYVPYGWRGTVTPEKGDYVFIPPNRSYDHVIRAQRNQNYYIAKSIMLTISGQLATGGRPIEGVLVSANNGGSSDTTDAQGRYSIKVPYGWSGEITMSKEGYKFEPPSMSYTYVTKNIRE